MKLRELIQNEEQKKVARAVFYRYAPEILDALRHGYSKKLIFKALKKHKNIPFAYRTMCKYIEQTWTAEEQRRRPEDARELEVEEVSDDLKVFTDYYTEPEE